MNWGKGIKKDPKKTYLGQNGGVALDHPRKCTARKHGGDPCRRFAIKGGTVCGVHGGSAPQVKAKAKRRMSEANDRAVVRAIRERIRGNYAEGSHLALAPVDLADDLAAYPAEPDTPATPEPPAAAQEPPIPADANLSDAPATSEPTDTALVDPVPQPEPPAEAPEPEPPRQIEVPLMGLTEAMTRAGRGNRQARVVRPRMRRR